ncbi:MAG TPA: PQQ-binding-like beta-propeller repeat protein [Methylomirabilota bacterium]|nr:PQQ-binding-like beta-propeller repeat protein [Methylomirabilota bacterium]
MPGPAGQLLAVGGEGPDGKLADLEIIPLVAPGTDWPGFRGPNRDGVSAESFAVTNWPKEGPPIRWRASLGRGLSSFAVRAGRVFTLGNSNETDTVRCLDADNGRVQWHFDYPCASTNHPMSVVPHGPAATPTVADGRVISLSREGDVFCLEEATGRVLWRTHLVGALGGKRPVYGYAQSPLVAGGLIFLEPGGTNGGVAALEAASGRVRWRAGTSEAGYSSARLTRFGERPALAVFQGEELVLFDATTGARLAAHRTTTRDFCNTITPALAGTSAFISNTGSDGTARVDWSTGQVRVLWQKTDLGLLFNSPVLWRGGLIAFNDARRNDHQLVCLDAMTGEPRWTTDEVEKGVFTVADDKMIVLTRQSELVVLDLAGTRPRVAARAQVLGGKSWAEPVLAGGRIFCRNNDGAAVCFDARMN